MQNFKEAAGIEGPFWDFSEINRYAHYQRDMFAILCTEALLRVGGVKDARQWAAKFAQADARCNRISARYDAIKDQPAIRWIGWDRL